MTRLIGTWKLPPGRAGENPLRVPGVRIRSTTSGLGVHLEADTTAVPATGSPWTVSAANGCVLEGTGAATFDPAFAYMVYGIPGDSQLYAIEQSAWASFVAGTDALPLAWVDAHDALTPRLSVAAVLLAFALLSGNSNGSVPTDAPSDTDIHQYGTDTSPALTYPTADVDNPQFADAGGTNVYLANYFYGRSPADAGLARNRLASNGAGVSLAIDDSGVLQYQSPVDGSGTVGPVSIASPAAFAGTKYDYVAGVNYSPTTHRWWVLFETANVGGSRTSISTTNRGLWALYYDESVHGAINPASGSNWAVGRAFQTQTPTLPGVVLGSGIGLPVQIYNNSTDVGVFDAIKFANDFDVDPGGGGASIHVTGGQILDFSSLMSGAPEQSLVFNVTCDGSGILSINGAGTVVAVISLVATKGVMPNSLSDDAGYNVVDNSGAIPAGIGTPTQWADGTAPFPSVWSYVPWYTMTSSTTFKLVPGASPLTDKSWDLAGFGFQNYPTGAQGVVTFSGNGAPIGPGSYNTAGNPLRMEDLPLPDITLPTSMTHATYKYWCQATGGVRGVEARSGVAGYREAHFTLAGASETVPWHYDDPNFPTVLDTPVPGGVGFSLAPGFSSFIVNAGTKEGQWFGPGPDGQTVGYPAHNYGGPAWTYYGSVDSPITDPTFTVDDPPGSTATYKPAGFGTGPDAPFLCADGSIVDSAGALDAVAAKIACSDGTTGLYAIISGDLQHRAGAFGTTWTIVEAGFSTEDTALLLAVRGGSIVLIEGTAGNVRVETWDGLATTRSAYLSFPTDNTFIPAHSGHLDYSAFSVAALTS